MATGQITISVEALEDQVTDLVTDALLKAMDGQVIILSERADELIRGFMAKVGQNQQEPGLTINGLVEMAYGTAKANGWHDRKGEMITTDHPMYLLAGLTLVKLALAEIVEAIRKPKGDNLVMALANFRATSNNLLGWSGAGVMHSAWMVVCDDVDKPLDGSRTQMLAWLQLIDSECAEAMEAVLNGDKANFAEELVADMPIRIWDTVGAINDTPGHFLGPIDSEATILAKNERNKARGYRHGGKRA